MNLAIIKHGIIPELDSIIEIGTSWNILENFPARHVCLDYRTLWNATWLEETNQHQKLLGDKISDEESWLQHAIRGDRGLFEE